MLVDEEELYCTLCRKRGEYVGCDAAHARAGRGGTPSELPGTMGCRDPCGDLWERG